MMKPDESAVLRQLATPPKPHTRVPAYLGDKQVLIDLNVGRPLIVDSSSMDLGLGLIREGLWEHWVTHHLVRHVLRRPDAVIVDVGANIGYFPVVLGSLTPSRRVWAFEPNSRAFEILKTNLFINGISRDGARRLALSDERGSLKLRHRPGESGGGHISVHEPDEGFTWETVAVERLDDVLPRDVAVDVIKIDVEGVEPRVLAGASATIARSPDVMLCFEAIPNSWRSQGFEAIEVFRGLKGRGFRLRLALPDPVRLVELEPEALVQQIEALPYVTSVFAMRDWTEFDRAAPAPRRSFIGRVLRALIRRLRRLIQE